MPRESQADQAIRDAAVGIQRAARAAGGIQRATRAAGADVHTDLGAAHRETKVAVREAIGEVRAALAEVWGPERAEDTSARGADGRLSRAQRKELTRELLLDAAMEVFAEKGYHGASLDDVADAAGFTKGAVYSNFTRKSDLFAALLERETARLYAAMAQLVEAVPLELLPDLAAELLASAQPAQESRTLMIEFWLAAVREAGLRPKLLGVTEGVADVFEAKLRASGTRPGLSGRELAVIFDALVTGLRMNRALEPHGDQPAVLAKAMRKLLADGRSGPGSKEEAGS